MMETSGDTGRATAPERATAPQAEAATPAPDQASDHPFGPDGAAILATEHWSLLASRSLIWNEAQSRATVFLSVLSAATIALALLADARRPGWPARPGEVADGGSQQAGTHPPAPMATCCTGVQAGLRTLQHPTADPH